MGLVFSLAWKQSGVIFDDLTSKNKIMNTVSKECLIHKSWKYFKMNFEMIHQQKRRWMDAKWYHKPPAPKKDLNAY